MSGGFFLKASASLMDFFTHRFASVHIDTLSDIPEETQDVWDSLATPYLKALESLHRHMDLGFDDLYALAHAPTMLPADSFLPRIEFAPEVTHEILDIAKSRDAVRLDVLNAAIRHEYRKRQDDEHKVKNDNNFIGTEHLIGKELPSFASTMNS